MLDQNYSSGAGKVKKQSNRVLTAVQDHRLDKPHAASIMRRGLTQAEPNNTKLARQVMAAVPRKAQQQKLLAEKSVTESKGKVKSAAKGAA